MPDTQRSVTLIGLGNMGVPMSERWLAAGWDVHGFDTTDAARERFIELGGHAHSTVENAAAAATTVVFMLPNSEIVDRVLETLLGAGSLSDGDLVIDMGSSQPFHSRENAKRLREIGVDFIDAPVSGGVRGVRAGTLAIMVGGDERLVERAQPLLDVLGTITHVGDVGAGHAAKALNNLVSAAHLWMTSEAVLIAEQFGIARETMVDVLNASTGRSVSSEVKWPKFILPGAFDSGFQAALLSKDADVAVSLAQTLGLPSLLGEDVAALWSRVARELPAGADHTEVARWIQSAFPVSSGPEGSR